MAPPTTPPPAPGPTEEETELAKLRARIYAETEEASRLAIEQRVKDEKKYLRNGGDGGFWGILMGLFFQLAEALGLDKWLAGMFGKPIPENNDKKALSKQIADVASKTVTAKAYDSAEEMSKAVHDNTLAFLMKPENRKFTASFNDAQLAEAAKMAGDSAKELYDKINGGYRLAYNKDHPVTVTPPKTTDNREQNVKNLVGAIIDADFKDVVLPDGTKEKLVELGAKVLLENPTLLKDKDKIPELAGKYADALLADPKRREQMQKKLDVPDDKLKAEVVGLLMPSLLGKKGERLKMLDDAVNGTLTAGTQPPKIEQSLTLAERAEDQLFKALAKKMADDPKIAEQFDTLVGKQYTDAKDREKDLREIAHALAPKMELMLNHKEYLKNQDPKAFGLVAGHIRNALRSHNGDFGKKGMLLSESALGVLADEIAVPFTNSQIFDKKSDTAAPDEFAKQADGRKKEFARSTIASEVSDTLEATTALGVMIKFPGWEPAKTYAKYYRKTGKGDKPEHYKRIALDSQLDPAQRKELHSVQRELADYAADQFMSFKKDQRDELGKLIAKTVLETKVDESLEPDAKRAALAATLDTNIKTALDANKVAISDMSPFNSRFGWRQGNTVDNINGNLGGDVFSTIANTFANVIRDPKDSTYDRIQQARQLSQPAPPAIPRTPGALGIIGGVDTSTTGPGSAVGRAKIPAGGARGVSDPRAGRGGPSGPARPTPTTAPAPAE